LTIPARLSFATLAQLPPAIRRPDYEIGSVKRGILHLGIGAFHRAHQAVTIDDCLGSDPRWGITGASLRSADTAQALNPQDGLYTISVTNNESVQHRIIGSVRDVIVNGAQSTKLLDAMTAPDTRIVSTTVTEKGYCHDPATGDLNQAHPDIQADLANPRNPHSAIGLIAEALRLRRLAGLQPFTLLCCDNLPNNGPTVAKIVSQYAGLLDPVLGDYIKEQVAFPATMVDRIVPATTDTERAAVAKALGVRDAWPVATEPFSQWVIEDKFTLGRPAFETAGAEITSNVLPFEHMKLRMLNGNHSTLAYLGYLAGHETVADAIADAPFRQLIHALMTKEIMPTLAMPQNVDVAAYRDALLARFSNRGLRHRTWQIAMDGTQKLPQRLLGTIRDRLARNESIALLALGVAAWMRYALGKDEKGQTIDLRDPMVDQLRQIAETEGHDVDRYAAALFRIAKIFGTDLPHDPRFTSAVTTHLRHLLQIGARQTIVKELQHG
jgi:fructuronate reductase